MTRRFPYCPLFLDLEEREVVIVGGGAVAARKAEMLLRHGARITIVAPEIAREIEQWQRDARLTTKRKRYEAGDLQRATLVFACTADRAVNAEITNDCRIRRIPVNVADGSDGGDFIVPAVIEQGSVQIAFSTGGQSPATARRLRADLERHVGPEYAELNDLLGSLRESAKATLPTDADRKRFFDGILEAGVLDLLRVGRHEEALQSIARACQSRGIEISDLLQRRLGES